MKLKDKVKALAKIIKDIAVTFKLTYCFVVTKVLKLLVILIKRVKEIVISFKREIKRE